MRTKLFVIMAAILMMALFPVPTSAQPTPPPLTLNGVAADASVTMGESILIETSTDAQLVLYSDLNCSSGENNIGWYTYDFLSNVTASASVRAWLISDNSVTSECLSMTWVPADPPILTINGVANNVDLTVGEPAVFQTQIGANIKIYPTANCTGFETVITSGTSIGPAVPGQQSARAFLLAEPGIVSNCLVATWSEAAPAAPTLTINYVAADANLTVGEAAVFTTDPDAFLRIFETADCSGTYTEPAPPYSTNPAGPTVISAIALLTADPSITSDCLTATWTAAPSTTPPSLTLNGVADHANLTVGEEALWEAETGAYVIYYASADCTGTGTVVTNTYATTSSVPGVISAEAYWDTSSTNPSHCLRATWLESPEEVVPSLTVNGSTADVYLTVGEEAVFETDADAFLRYFPNNSCIGTGTDAPSTHATIQTSPGVISARAFLTEDPTITSGCLFAVWNEDDSATPTSTVTPAGTPAHATPEPPATDDASENSQSDDNPAKVTGLPSTGAGSSSLPLVIITGALMALFCLGIAGWKRQRES